VNRSRSLHYGRGNIRVEEAIEGRIEKVGSRDEKSWKKEPHKSDADGRAARGKLSREKKKKKKEKEHSPTSYRRATVVGVPTISWRGERGGTRDAQKSVKHEGELVATIPQEKKKNSCRAGALLPNLGGDRRERQREGRGNPTELF